MIVACVVLAALVWVLLCAVIGMALGKLMRRGRVRKGSRQAVAPRVPARAGKHKGRA